MKNIVVLNDHTQASEHATAVAAQIAAKVRANILLLNITEKNYKPVMVDNNGLVIENADFFEERSFSMDVSGAAGRLNEKAETNAAFSPKTINIDAWDMTDNELTQFILKNDTWMMVLGTGDTTNTYAIVNVQQLLNKVSCPLLLVPHNNAPLNFERLIYTADLRYCRLSAVRFLAEFARPYNATLMIAHLSADGLPHMEDDYAFAVFNNEVGGKVSYDKMTFNNIKDRNLAQVADVMINGMHAGMLAMINRNFHFQGIVGQPVSAGMTLSLPVPVMVFPS